MQILLRNIDRNITAQEIIELLGQSGKVSSFDLVKDEKTGGSKGFGFAEMPNMDEAAKAISHLNGLKIGSSRLRVKPAAHSTISKHKNKN